MCRMGLFPLAGDSAAVLALVAVRLHTTRRLYAERAPRNLESGGPRRIWGEQSRPPSRAPPRLWRFLLVFLGRDRQAKQWMAFNSYWASPPCRVA